MSRNYTNTYYTQAVGGMGNYGSYVAGRRPERLTYPNQAGSSYLTQFGEDPSLPVPPPPNGPPAPLPNGPPAQLEVPTGAKVLGVAWTALSVAGSIGGVYHGYKRNNSIGWALVWGFFGGIAPVITLPLSAAQGFGKRKVGKR
jgi:hypothetical protein